MNRQLLRAERRRGSRNSGSNRMDSNIVAARGCSLGHCPFVLHHWYSRRLCFIKLEGESDGTLPTFNPALHDHVEPGMLVRAQGSPSRLTLHMILRHNQTPTMILVYVHAAGVLDFTNFNCLQVPDLTAQLEQELRHDVRFHPIMSLYKARESPDVQYYSPEVVKIIDEMRHWNDDKELRHHERPSWKTVPFRLEGDTVDVAHKVADVVERVEHKLADDVHLVLKAHTKVFHYDPEIEQVVHEDDFKNWGETVRFRAGYTLVVRTIAGVCKVVKWAASEGRKVRVAGFRHSWRYIVTSSPAHWVLITF